MDKIMERLECLEAQCTVLNEENCANKVTIKILEKKLSECEKHNKELTDQREAASSKNADESKNEKRFRDLEKEILKLRRQQQQQIQDTNNKFHKIDKLQHLFNCTVLKKATADEKIERVSSRLDGISDAVDDLEASRTQTEETQQAQASSAATPVESQCEDSEIATKVKSCMTRARGCTIPLSRDDYGSLSALESIAGIPNGPALQFVTNWIGNSETAQFTRQVSKHIKKFHTKGINTTQKAMSEYVKLCDQHTCETPLVDTKYHPIEHNTGLGCGDYILAIDSRSLRILDRDTKQTLTNGSEEESTPLEHIDRHVRATIRSYLRK